MSKKKMEGELFEAAEMRRLEEEYNRRRLGMVNPGSQAEPLDGGRGILPFRIEGSADGSYVTGRAGLSLALEAMRAYKLDELVEEHINIKKRERGFSEAQVVESVVLLQLAGGEHMEDIEILREDKGFCRMIGGGIPSPDVVRDFLVAFNDPKLLAEAKKKAEAAQEKSYVPEESEALKGLSRVASGFVERSADPSLGCIATLDHDATVIDSHKQEARFHYKGEKGYQPVAVLWKEQGLVVGDEFRDGNVPAGKDNLKLIARSFRSLPEWVKVRRFRSDTACYEEEVLKWLSNPERDGGPRGEIGFTISADMTKELKKECDGVWEEGQKGDKDHPRWRVLDDTRGDETVEWSEVEFTPGDWPKKAEPLRYLVIRFKPRQGRLYADGSAVRYLAVVSNREGLGDELIRWHWEKAGTIEHLHDESKNGLGAGVLPCGEFGANAAWYRLSLLSFNVATVIRRHALPPEEQRSKMKRLRFLLFNVVATFSTHSRYLIARVSDSVLRRVRWLHARKYFVRVRKGLIPCRI